MNPRPADARVSVVIPVRDGARYLGAAIESVLAQGDGVGEVLVVDDGSHDRSSDVARACGPAVRVLTQPPTGTGSARNRGAAAAAHPLLAFLDSDDLWTSGRLAVLRDALCATPALDAAFGQVEEFVSPELADALAGQVRCKPPGPGMLAGGMLLWRDAFERIGPFDTRGAEFVSWFLQARAAGLRWAVLDHLVLRRRIHDRNTVRTDPRVTADYLRIARARVAERR